MLPTPSVLMPSRSLSLDPYILGLWLGDGTAGTNIISMASADEKEALAQIKTSGFSYYIHRKKPEDNFAMYGVKGLKEGLLPLGCLSKKHIPEQYLFSSEEDRLALLQGLMDSDGTCKRNGNCAGMCMFSNTNHELAKGVFYLAASLGLRPSIISHLPEKRGKKRIYQVYFVGLKSMPPFRLARKLAHCKEKRHKVGRYVRSITKINSVPVNCIKVDADDHLYLAGYSLVPTHNSEDDGIIVKRKSNPAAATVEAWGLVDGQPVSKHFSLCVYDDVVTRESCTTPDMIAKVNQSWELSLNLGVDGGRRRYIGTRYHYNDTYKLIMDRKAAIPRIHPATKDGRVDGKPVLLHPDALAQKRREMGPFVFGAQMMLDPRADEVQGFKENWLHYWPCNYFHTFNKMILCDPASEKKKGSDYTVFMVIGLGEDQNYYIIDIVRDRMSLTDRANALFALHREFRPQFVGYEKYGKDSDIEHYNDRMNRDNYRFGITPLGGKVKKEDRIRSLIPLFEQGRIFIPDRIIKTNYEGVTEDLTRAFINEEYLAFPVAAHDDMLDCLARINDPDCYRNFPIKGAFTAKATQDVAYDPFSYAHKQSTDYDVFAR
jgi:predicted phage terminase large subunit-like protein